MNTQFFDNCTTAEDVKNEYRRLCKQWHPDLGPQAEAAERTKAMQEINAAYARASAMFRQEEMREKARTRGRPEPTQKDYTDAAAVDECIRAAIEKIITLDGLEIEICGLWVWVGGETKKHKDELKAAEYKWAAKKTKWYYWRTRRRIQSVRHGRDSPTLRQPTRDITPSQCNGGFR
jgi:DnaJ domain